jgi:hypothetical protein
VSLHDEHEWRRSLLVTAALLRRRFEILRDSGYMVLPLGEAVRSLLPRCSRSSAIQPRNYMTSYYYCVHQRPHPQYYATLSAPVRPFAGAGARSAGEGTTYEACREIAQRHGLADRIVHPGHVPEVKLQSAAALVIVKCREWSMYWCSDFMKMAPIIEESISALTDSGIYWSIPAESMTRRWVGYSLRRRAQADRAS